MELGGMTATAVEVQGNVTTVRAKAGIHALFVMALEGKHVQHVVGTV